MAATLGISKSSAPPRSILAFPPSTLAPPASTPIRSHDPDGIKDYTLIISSYNPFTSKVGPYELPPASRLSASSGESVGKINILFNICLELGIQKMFLTHMRIHFSKFSVGICNQVSKSAITATIKWAVDDRGLVEQLPPPKSVIVIPKVIPNLDAPQLGEIIECELNRKEKHSVSFDELIMDGDKAIILTELFNSSQVDLFLDLQEAINVKYKKCICTVIHGVRPKDSVSFYAFEGNIRLSVRLKDKSDKSGDCCIIL